jgi:two-component system sensor histidine kinase DesK
MTDAMNDTSPRALARMRRYTTLSLTAALGFFTLLVAIGTASLPLQIAAGVTGVLVVSLAAFWERRPPLWLALAAVLAGGSLWCYHLAIDGMPGVVILPAVALALLISHTRRHRSWWTLAGLAVLLGPVLAAVLVEPGRNWMPWAAAAALSYLGAVALFALNTYGWGLYLEIDSLRRSSAELAVAQERYRFATDLHDIQGHTLHVIRLKTRLAAKLLERDPAAARVQLEEADELIGETLANTRSLAFGDRRVSLASELANAGALLEAAGIEWSVTGAPATGPHEELLGLVVRETTTNVLRHARATEVSVEFGPGRLVITNDGSPATTRPLSGLARLAERFEAAGGALRTSISNGRFTTEASIP